MGFEAIMPTTAQLLEQRPYDYRPLSETPEDPMTSYMPAQHGRLKDLPSLSVQRRKQRVDKYNLLAVLGSLLCLAVACVTVLPSTSIPWRLGLTRQFQVIGFLLSVMNQCLSSVAPQCFVLVEARFGPSYLQNYDAILRKSFTLPRTNKPWRVILSVFVILPMGLSLAYKEFDHGTGHISVTNETGSYYGLTAPSGLQEGSTDGIGLSFMANATIAYYGATLDDQRFPSFPQAYGFNTLLLSNTSSAKLDGPFPDYVRSIQEKLTTSEAYMLTAGVNATVTSYNESIESHRDDDEFWDYYLSEMTMPWDPPKKGTYNETDLALKLSITDMFISQKMALLMNDLAVRNTSWVFASIIPAPNKSLSDSDNDLATARSFKQAAMLFHTRRELCKGTWIITYNSVQLRNGTCNQLPLPDHSQVMFTNATLAVPTFYKPLLIEYLGPFAAKRHQSPWKLPTFCTVLAGVYWSRTLALNGYYAWGPNKTIPAETDPSAQPRANLYYLVEDEVVSIRPTMNASPLLFLTLTVQPVLTILFLVVCFGMYSTPIDRGFGMIAVLAGVCVETLKLLKGASVSGELKRPLRVRIAVKHPVMEDRPSNLRNEYILGDEAANDKLSSPRRRKAFSSPLNRSFELRQATWRRSDPASSHGNTQYYRV